MHKNLPPSSSEKENKEEKTIVTKTPIPSNIKLFSSLFSSGILVVLIRDGRSVAESAIRTWGLHFDEAVNQWVKGARTILQFVEQYGTTSRFHTTVKYEDLYMNTVREIRRIFDQAGLAVDSYPYEELDDEPIVGSSTYQPKEGVSWNAVADDGSFNPLSRWSSWSKEEHMRFNWLAASEMEALGYNVVDVPRTSFTRVRMMVQDGWSGARRRAHASRRLRKTYRWLRSVSG